MTITKLFFGYLMLACASFSFGGVLSPGLEEILRTSGSADFVPVLIMLDDGLHADAEALRLARAGAALTRVHEQLVQKLKDTASAQQAPVLQTLRTMESSGMARNVTPHWIANLIAADMTKAGIEQIVNTTAVLEVGTDVEIMLTPLMESVASGASDASAATLPAACALQPLWAEGAKGEGRLVCVLGEAFRPQNSTLAAAFHGNTSAVESALFNPLPLRTQQYCGDQSNQLLSVICGAGDIGIAPASEWLAADMFVCGKSHVSTFLRTLEWAVDPDGNGATVSDVPDAILCPWTWTSQCYGALPTNITDVFDNAEALGPVLVFAANNDPGGNAAFSGPASFEKLLAVGTLDKSGTQVHSTSARGPSGCDPRTVKPDLVAPGSQILTASPDATGGFARATGTGIAAAAVAGTVLLLREKNPNLTAPQIKQSLLQSAADLGTPGPDLVFGYGELQPAAALNIENQFAAVGDLQVAVRYGGQGVSDARVVASSPIGEFYANTNDVGSAYFEHLPAQTHYRLSVGRLGYASFLQPDSILLVPKKITELFVNLTRDFADGAEVDQGWEFGLPEDDATGGQWVRGEPSGTFAEGAPVQPAKAFEGSMCFFTANGAEGAEAGAADVDGGKTTLRSPEFSLVELSRPVLTFHYWFSNDHGPNRGGDFFRVQLSNDGGQTWTPLINTSTSTSGWTSASISIEDLLPPTKHMILQFIAEDQGAGSLVEAAVDDLRITGDPVAPEPPRNLILDVQFEQVVLKWNSSRGATLYKVYVSNDPEVVVRPEFFIFSTPDTTTTVPLSTIPYEKFYFAVTATN